MPKRNWVAPLLIAGLIVLLLLFPVVETDKYRLHIGIMVLYGIILATSLRLTFATGQISMAHVAFLGLGAYTSTILVMRLGLSFWVALPAAGLGSALVAAGLGYPTLRIKGLYFIMCTFAFTEIVAKVWIEWVGLFGGSGGIANIPVPNAIVVPGLFTLDFDSKPAMYYLALGLAIITMWVMYRIDRSRLGMALKSIEESDMLSECIGVNLMRYKMLAFCVSSFFAGLAGSFYAHYFLSISPFHFSSTFGMDILTYTVLGGSASVFGPAAGTFVIVVMGEVLRAVGDWDVIFTGAVLIAVMLFMSGGLADVPRLLRLAFRRLFLIGERPKIVPAVENDLA